MNLYKTIFITILLGFLFSFGSASESRIGLLRSNQETYSHELDYTDGIAEMLQDLGASSILIDYNNLVSHGEDLENVVRDFLKKNSIKKVIIPGNYYNLDSPPFAPNTNRQDVTAILTKMASEQRVYLMGICGGLQGIMHAQGVEIVKVKSIQGNIENHLASDPNPHAENVPLHEVRVDPTSRLATIVKEHVTLDKNGWVNLYLPDAHSRVLNNSVENITKINAAGYKIVGFSNDGMIEIVEDEFGNLHFQGHPEGLLISEKIGDNISSLRNASTSAIKALFEDFINR